MKHERSKERVKELGEVFTPAIVVKDMLDLLEVKDWGNSEKVFYEPTCGNGQFVVQIIRRQVEAFVKNHPKLKGDQVYRYALVVTSWNLWATDIDETNVFECRNRAMQEYTNVMYDQGKIIPRDLWHHLGQATTCQIQQNDALTCLEKDEKAAEKAAQKTKASRDFYAVHGHKPLDFSRSYWDILHEEKKQAKLKEVLDLNRS